MVDEDKVLEVKEFIKTVDLEMFSTRAVAKLSRLGIAYCIVTLDGNLKEVVANIRSSEIGVELIETLISTLLQ